MADEDEYEFEDQDDVADLEDYEPTEEERAAAERFFEMARRHPTIVLVLKVVTRQARMKRLRDLQAPPVVLEAEQRLREKVLDELSHALPFDAKTQSYPLDWVLQHFRQEFLRDPESGTPRKKDS